MLKYSWHIIALREKKTAKCVVKEKKNIYRKERMKISLNLIRCHEFDGPTK